MSNVVPIHGEGSWPHELARLTARNQMYEKALLAQCAHSEVLLNLVDLLIDPFRKSEAEKVVDQGRDLIAMHRALVT